MNYGEGGLSASDVALLTGNGNNGGFGNNGDGWWIILLFLLGFGRNGFGGGYGGYTYRAGTDSYANVRALLTMNRTLEAEAMLNRMPKNAEW